MTVGPAALELPRRVLRAGQWRLAAELCSLLPDGHVRQRDLDGDSVLSVEARLGAKAVRLDVVLGGQVLRREGGAVTMRHGGSTLWADLHQPGRVRRTASDVLVQCLHTSGKANRSPDRLGYQVLAHLLAARVLDQDEWEVRSPLRDDGRTLAMEPQWVPDDAALATLPHYRVWAVLVGGRAIAWLYGGWLLRPGGERIDLVQEQARGASLADLAALVARRPAGRRAERLPGVAAVPGPEADHMDFCRWIWGYSGYQRVADSPGGLADVLQSLQAELDRTGQVPEGVGPDLLRTWLFLRQREDKEGWATYSWDAVRQGGDWGRVVEAVFRPCGQDLTDSV